MSLSFPNSSRSYDASRKVIRFVGYDGMMQIPFTLEAAAVSGSGSGEHALLSAFDAARSSIHDAARHNYRPGNTASYSLKSSDLR